MVAAITIGKNIRPTTTVNDVVEALTPLRGKTTKRDTYTLELAVGSVSVYRFFGAFTKTGRRFLPIDIEVKKCSDAAAPTVRVSLRDIFSITPRLDAEQRALAERAVAVDRLLEPL